MSKRKVYLLILFIFAIFGLIFFNNYAFGVYNLLIKREKPTEYQRYSVLREKEGKNFINKISPDEFKPFERKVKLPYMYNSVYGSGFLNNLYLNGKYRSGEESGELMQKIVSIYHKKKGIVPYPELLHETHIDDLYLYLLVGTGESLVYYDIKHMLSEDLAQYYENDLFLFIKMPVKLTLFLEFGRAPFIKWHEGFYYKVWERTKKLRGEFLNEGWIQEWVDKIEEQKMLRKKIKKNMQKLVDKWKIERLEQGHPLKHAAIELINGYCRTLKNQNFKNGYLNGYFPKYVGYDIRRDNWNDIKGKPCGDDI